MTHTSYSQTVQKILYIYTHTHIDRERTNAKADGEKGNNM